jgi:hypothetical protein
MLALPRSQIGGQSGVRFAARFFIDALSMWVGELLRVLSILKMAERRGSPSTPAPLQYLSLKAPVQSIRGGVARSDGVVRRPRASMFPLASSALHAQHLFQRVHDLDQV